ncbi:MAG: hypothetical protein WCU88_07605 [Elusimicrobiota bacterium]|jgi:hypothetical protein
MSLWYCAALFFSLAQPAFARTLDEEILRLRAAGFETVESARSSDLSVLHLHRKEGGTSRILVYSSEKNARGRAGQAKLLHFNTFMSGVRLASIHSAGKIPDIAGDGASIIAYVYSYSGIDQESLVLLRFKDGRLSPVGKPLPFAQFLDVNKDGRLEIVSKENPLGPLFVLQCDSFFVPPRAAVRTRIFRLAKGGRLEDISKGLPSFYKEQEAELEARLHAEDPMKTGRYGEYLGTALSLYYDAEMSGRKKSGFDRLKKTLAPPKNMPRKAQDCFQEMSLTLRKKLSIPADW